MHIVLDTKLTVSQQSQNHRIIKVAKALQDHLVQLSPYH